MPVSAFPPSSSIPSISSNPVQLSPTRPEFILQNQTQQVSFHPDIAPPEEDTETSWISQELYRDSPVTVGQAVLGLLEFFLSNSLSKKALGGALKLYDMVLPKPNNMPKTKYFLDKLLETLIPNENKVIKKYRVCEECSYFIGEWDSTESIRECCNCTGSKLKGLFVEYDLARLLKDALETRDLAKLVESYGAETEGAGLIDIVGSSGYKRIKKFIPGVYDLFMMWNVDEAPVSNSSNGQICTVQVQVVNIAPQHRRNYQFVSGVYYSSEKKAIMNTFLTSFVEKMKQLYDIGIDWIDKDKREIHHSKVVAPIASMDSVARAPCQNVQGHQGEYGCSTCEHPGQSCETGNKGGHNRVYPILGHDVPLQTGERMQAQAEEAVNGNYSHVRGVKGPSILALIPFLCLALSFVPDHMHAILLGVVRMLLSLFFDSSNHRMPWYIKPKHQREIDALLASIKPPDFIPRPPRKLKHRKYWKASELRSFLLFYGPIVLKGRLKEEYYNHFLLLSHATRLMLQSEIPNEDLDFAGAMYYFFVADIPKLYGLNRSSFNAHLLTHIVMFVRLWGPMWAWSAFSFEDGNRYFLKIIHGPNKVEREMLNTMKIVNAYWILRHKLSMNSSPARIESMRLGRVKLLDSDNSRLCLSLISDRSVRELAFRDKIYVFYRCRVRNEIYTSQLYKRQVKRNNFYIFWNDGKKYGIVKYYTQLNGVLFAIVQELIRDINANRVILNYGFTLDLSMYIIPFKKTYIMHALNVSEIEGKMICVNNYLCMSPNFVEKKL
ncbi:hypothetical protein QAD02_001760 [Eretmocerus hayati]|uniref:Uncharacterized protein n=1 Tax=Eretmocerus hayati TaxID=131215 RepID=A0ACC2NHV1_9HYME|nr:hypothetical protein QAD02_001760 [Eretmocerus hayati]